MTASEIWPWLASNLASAFLAFLGVLALLGVAPKAIGEKFLGHFFDRKLETFKHQQDTEIEALKAKLAHIGDRGIRSNEREYAAIITAWENFVDAYISTQRCVVRFMSHPDFSEMGSQRLAEYLDTTELSEPQKKQMKDAEDKSGMYAKIVRHRLINQSGAAIYDARSILRKQGIFIPEQLELSFESALEMLSAAQVHELVEADHGYMKDENNTIGRLFKDGPQVFSKLKGEVKARIFLID